MPCDSFRRVLKIFSYHQGWGVHNIVADSIIEQLNFRGQMLDGAKELILY